MARAATALEGRHDFSAFGGADPQPVRNVHRVRVRREGRPGHDRRPGRRLPAGDGPAHRRRPPRGRDGQDGGDSGRRGARRATTGPRRGSGPGEGTVPPAGRPRAAAGGNERNGERRGTMNAKTYTVRESEIERRWFVVDATGQTLGRLATQVARVLDGQAQADLHPAPRHRRPRDRPQRGQDRGQQRQDRTRSCTSATAAIRRATRKSRSASSSSAAPRRSSGAPSRACSRTPGSAPSSSGS